MVDPLGLGIWNAIKNWLKGSAKETQKRIPNPVKMDAVTIGYVFGCVIAKKAWEKCMEEKLENEMDLCAEKIDCSDLEEAYKRICGAAGSIGELLNY
jgi:hypothetical protein